VTAYAQKSRLVIQARVRFASAIVRGTHLAAGLWLRRRAEHPLLRRVEDLGAQGYVHHFRLEAPADIDEALRALVREAYSAGTQDSRRPRLDLVRAPSSRTRTRG
jgi:hypothetical protein